MTRPLHPSISNKRAWAAFLLLGISFSLPAVVVLTATLLASGPRESLWWSGGIAIGSFVAILVIFHSLLFRMVTVGNALLAGTMMILYAILSSGSIQAWEKFFLQVSKGSEIGSVVLWQTALILLNAQTLLSVFSAAVGAGLVSNGIFSARIRTQAPDTKSGLAK